MDANRYAVLLTRAAIAAVWCYEGMWCKILGDTVHQKSIVASVPGLTDAWLTPTMIGLGLAETAVGLWALSGARPRGAAWIQTALVVSFNAGGLFFAGGRIAEPGQMLTGNAVLLAAAWLVSGTSVRRPVHG